MFDHVQINLELLDDIFLLSYSKIQDKNNFSNGTSKREAWIMLDFYFIMFMFLPAVTSEQENLWVIEANSMMVISI